MRNFEEYKFFIEHTQRLSERRQVATQTFLAVNTAIFTVLAFLIKDIKFEGWGLVLVSLPLFLVGMLVCLIWRRILEQFKILIKWRYEQLRDMEQATADSHQIFTKEYARFYQPQHAQEHFGFARLEERLPQLFLLLYSVYGVGLLVATIIGFR